MMDITVKKAWRMMEELVALINGLSLPQPIQRLNLQPLVGAS
jgi:hypothetical protein